MTTIDKIKNLTWWNEVIKLKDILLSIYTEKANYNNPIFTGNVSLPETTTIGNITSGQLGYLSGVTSDIQQQLGNKSNYVTVSTYSEVLLINSIDSLLIVKVLNDENKGIKNTIYHIYPDGVRMWIASVQDN